ncbi:hypothetical protein LTR62_003452 [Meristemomyces frigidus]|uniref:Enoyl reductase (ER) domain-containing protein n=1 Tax=Meristemomyces frigidus TaxID=1508187 RepID=A0AAN7TFG8_9PEZI|nr:hypothetical protein LTR62_003452 [Meristemomyces frigidus]
MGAVSQVEAWSVLEHGKPLRKTTRPFHSPTGSEVVVKVTHCGVCHSDVHLWEGFFELGGNRGRVAVEDAGVELPRAVGHEIVGEVVAVGPDVEPAEVSIGDRRIVYPWIGCNKPGCVRCQNEEDNLCESPANLGMTADGGFASHVVVSHARYLIDFGNVNPALACTYSCSGITVLSAIQKLMPMRPENPIVLIGAGGLGIQAIAMLKALGHQAIISVDVAKDKRAVAELAGAQYVCGSGEGVKKEIIGMAARPILGTIDFVNNSSTAQLAYDILTKGGHMVQVGIMGGELSLSLVAFIFKAVTVSANMTGNLKHLREVVQMAREGKLAAIPVTEIPWDEANVALMRLRDGKVKGRLILKV